MTKHIVTAKLDHRHELATMIDECLAFDDLNLAFAKAALLCQDVLDAMIGESYEDYSIDIHIAESVPVSYDPGADLPLGALDEQGTWCSFSYSDRDPRITHEVLYDFDQLCDQLPDLSAITTLGKEAHS